jgi:hypothetical protein
MKAIVTQVNHGNLSIEGLMAEDGTYHIAVPQLVSHDLVPQHNASRDLKALLPEGFQFVKMSTTLNPKPVNVISLKDFEVILRKLDKAGNKAAEKMVDDLVGLSLTQLFSDAFGIKFEKEERQAWLIDRQNHREDFHPKFTSWLKIDGCEGAEYAIEVNNMKKVLGLPVKTVNTYDTKQLRALDLAYVKYDTLRTIGMSHKRVMSMM